MRGVDPRRIAGRKITDSVNNHASAGIPGRSTRVARGTRVTNLGGRSSTSTTPPDHEVANMTTSMSDRIVSPAHSNGPVDLAVVGRWPGRAGGRGDRGPRGPPGGAARRPHRRAAGPAAPTDAASGSTRAPTPSTTPARPDRSSPSSACSSPDGPRRSEAAGSGTGAASTCCPTAPAALHAHLRPARPLEGGHRPSCWPGCSRSTRGAQRHLSFGEWLDQRHLPARRASTWCWRSPGSPPTPTPPPT